MKFIQTNDDLCLYECTDGEPIIIAVYVEDILIARRTDKRSVEVKTAIANQFDIKDMGKLHYYLGVKVVQDLEAGTIWMGQPTYTENFVSIFSRQNARPVRHQITLV